MFRIMGILLRIKKKKIEKPYWAICRCFTLREKSFSSTESNKRKEENYGVCFPHRFSFVTFSHTVCILETFMTSQQVSNVLGTKTSTFTIATEKVHRKSRIRAKCVLKIEQNNNMFECFCFFFSFRHCCRRRHHRQPSNT